MKSFHFEFPDKNSNSHRSRSPVPTQKKHSVDLRKSSTSPLKKSPDYSFKEHSDIDLTCSQTNGTENHFQGDLSLLSQELQRLNTMSEDLRNEKEHLMSHLRLMQTEEDTENKLLDIIADKKRLEELIVIYTNQAHKSSDKNFAEFVRQINLWQRNFFASQMRFADVGKAIEFLSSERKRLEDKFESKEREFQSLNDKLREAIEKQAKIVDDNNRLKQLVLRDVEDKISARSKEKVFEDFSDAKIPELKTQLKKLLEENKNLKLQNKQLSAQCHKVKEHSGLLHSDEIKKYTDRIEDLESKYSITIAENECLRDQLNSKLKETEAVETRIKQSISKLSKNESKISSGHISVQEIEDLENIFEKRITIANQEIELLQKKVNLLERAVSKATSDEKSARNEKARLQKELDGFAKQLELFKGQEIILKDLEDNLEEKNELEKILNSKITQLTKELEASKSNLNQVQQSNQLISELTKTIDVLKTECESLIKENEELVIVVQAANGEKMNVNEINRYINKALAEAEIPYENIQGDNIQEMLKCKIDLLLQCFVDLRSSLLSKSAENSALSNRGLTASREIENAKRDIVRYLQINQEGQDLDKVVKLIIEECERLDEEVNTLNTQINDITLNLKKTKSQNEEYHELLVNIYKFVQDHSTISKLDDKAIPTSIATEIIQGINQLTKTIKKNLVDVENYSVFKIENSALKVKLEETMATIKHLSVENERKERLASGFAEDVGRIISKIENLRNQEFLQVPGDDSKDVPENSKSKENLELEILEKRIKKKLKHLASENDKLKMELETAFRMNEDLAHINTDLAQKLNEVRSYADDLQNLKKAIDLASATKSEQNEALHQRIEDLENERNNCLSEITRLKDQKVSLETKINSFEPEKVKQANEIKSLNQTILELKVNIDAGNNENASKARRIQELETENFQLLELKTQIDTLIGEVQGLKVNMTQLEKEKEDALNQVIVVKKELEVMVHEKNQKINDIHTKYGELMIEYKNVRNQIEMKSSEFIIARNESEIKAEQKITQLEATITQLEARIAELVQENNNITTELLNFEKTTEKLSDELQIATRQVEELKPFQIECKELKAGVMKIEASKLEVEAEVNRLIVALDLAKSEASCTEKTLKGKIEELIKQIDDHKAKLIEAAAYLDMVNELKNKINVLTAENALLKRTAPAPRDSSADFLRMSRRSVNEVNYESDRKSICPEESYCLTERYEYSLKEKYEKLQKENDDLKLKLVIQNDRYSSVRSSNPFEADDLRNSLNSKSREHDILKISYDQLRINYDNLMKSQTEHLAQIKSLQESNTRLMLTERMLNDKITALTSENITLKAKVESNNNNDSQKHTRSRSTAVEKSEQSELERLRGINKNYQDLQGKYLLVKVDSERKTGELEMMKRQLEDMKSRLDTANSNNNNITGRLVLSPLKNKQVTFEHSGAGSSRKHDENEDRDVDRLKSKNAELLKENKRLRVLASEVMNEMSILRKTVDKSGSQGDSGMRAKLKSIINPEN